MTRIAMVAVSLLGIVFTPGAARAEEITVSAAISLKDSLGEIARWHTEPTGDQVTFNFGSSGQLAGQIRQGAPVDVFISAGEKQVDELEAAGLVDPATRCVIAGNRLVLIVTADTKDPPGDFKALAGEGVKRLAMGDPKTVPAGDYAAQVIESLKLGDAVKDKLVYGTNVRQVLDYVERGEVDAGIVYHTDAMRSGDKVRVIATAEPSWHRPVTYPAVVVGASTKQDAGRRFLNYLATGGAREILARHGFTEAPAPASTRPTRSSAP
ncbi:MAG: molybdate ABC transporter substrate-binding protein [Tepidisphaeraceae bacterium]